MSTVTYVTEWMNKKTKPNQEQENVQAHHRMSEGAYISLALKSKGHKNACQL